jgi:hypothetical protein
MSILFPVRIHYLNLDFLSTLQCKNRPLPDLNK